MEPFSFPPSFYVFFGVSMGLILVVGLIAALVVRFRQHQSEAREARLGLDRIRKMSGEEFEGFLAGLFRQMGYKVEQTASQGDFGADLILTDRRTGRRTAVQAKCWNDKQTIGVPDLHEVFGGAAFYDCQERLFVSTCRYTEPARVMAQKTGTRLWDLDDLASAIEQVAAGKAPGTVTGPTRPLPPQPTPVAQSPVSVPARTPQPRPTPMAQPEKAPTPSLSPSGPPCPVCGSVMTQRSIAGQLAWLCSRFPKCNGARTIDRV